jgi:hypothetical protein
LEVLRGIYPPMRRRIFMATRSNNVESDGGDLGNTNGIKHVYRDDTWKHKFFNYDPKPHEFVGVSKLNIEWN